MHFYFERKREPPKIQQLLVFSPLFTSGYMNINRFRNLFTSSFRTWNGFGKNGALATENSIRLNLITKKINKKKVPKSWADSSSVFVR